MFLLFIVLFENVFGDEWLLAYVVVLVGGIGIAAVGNLAASSMTLCMEVDADFIILNTNFTFYSNRSWN